MLTKKYWFTLLVLGNCFFYTEYVFARHKTTSKFDSHKESVSQPADTPPAEDIKQAIHTVAEKIEHITAQQEHSLAEAQKFLEKLAIHQAGKNKPKKELKILVLIICSDQLPVYTELQKIWRSYMHYDPKHVECYFIRSDPHLPKLFEIKGDTITSQAGPEGWTPDSASILNKTILSIEAMLPRMHEFDYIVRTNLSSFYIFPRLLKYLETAPRIGFYSGSNIGVESETPIASGCGFVMSPDVASLLVINKPKIFNRSKLPDDMEIGKFFYKRNVKLTPYYRVDIASLGAWERVKNVIPNNVFHFRLKQTDRLRTIHEVTIHKELVNMFYPGKKI